MVIYTILPPFMRTGSWYVRTSRCSGGWCRGSKEDDELLNVCMSCDSRLVVAKGNGPAVDDVVVDVDVEVLIDAAVMPIDIGELGVRVPRGSGG